MSSGSENNALVEIALALSMAFFSLMVLTMVSMGVGMGSKQAKISLPNSLSLKQANPSEAEAAEVEQSSAIQPDKLAVYYQDKFYNAALQPLSAVQFQTKNIKYLAVEPNLSMRQTIEIKSRFTASDVVVTTLNDAWLKTLKEKIK